MKYWHYASVILLVFVSIGIWHTQKPLPAGVGEAWPVRRVPVEAVHFLADRTYVDQGGQRHSDQRIFNEIIRLIENAQEYIVVDMFLYNDWQGPNPEEHRALAAEFTDALVAKKQQQPEMPIVVVTDPINIAYGGDNSRHLKQLREAGIDVVMTNLKPLRDSNPVYSAPWRFALQWFGNTDTGGLLPHPFQSDGPKVTLRTWLRLLNFKANHRKVVVADQSVLITSANPHDGSSAHSNVAVTVDAGLAADAIASEAAVAQMSNTSWPEIPQVEQEGNEDSSEEVAVQLLTEGAIEQELREVIDQTQAGDEIEMVMFYLSDRDIVDSLVAASGRGVTIRAVLDPNKDAFGHTKNGVPNRPVVHELRERSNGEIAIRWCDTHGEQCHSKMVLIHTSRSNTLVVGSANLTKRNIGDYNLETNILVQADGLIPALADAREYFLDVWENRNGRIFSTDYEQYADSSVVKKALYRWQEASGMSSF